MNLPTSLQKNFQKIRGLICTYTLNPISILCPHSRNAEKSSGFKNSRIKPLIKTNNLDKSLMQNYRTNSKVPFIVIEKSVLIVK